ncbi:MAG: hypothetical protein RLN86_00745 [Cyclobacteriaceae bacterium]
MKVDLSHILALLIVGSATLLSHNSYAQDDGLPMGNFQEPNHSELNLNDDKSLIFENENRPTRTIQSVARDTVSNKARVAKKTSANEKKEGDAMSFNFLYYIIQRYKISDIVDQ